jgi:hypothetical protein
VAPAKQHCNKLGIQAREQRMYQLNSAAASKECKILLHAVHHAS